MTYGDFGGSAAIDTQITVTGSTGTLTILVLGVQIAVDGDNIVVA